MGLWKLGRCYVSRYVWFSFPCNLSCCFVEHLRYASIYTDYHDVDEDLRTHAHCGGDWWRGSYVGIIQRDLYQSPTAIFDIAASSDIRNWSNIMRIGIMSTKIWQLSRFITVVLPVEAKPVSHVEIWTILHPSYPMLLLPKNNIPPPT